MTWPARGPRMRRSAGRPIRLLALLVQLAAAAACEDQSDHDTAPAASPAPTAPPTTTPPTTTAPSRSTDGAGTLPQPIRDLHQGDRLFGVYWVAASLGEPVRPGPHGHAAAILNCLD